MKGSLILALLVGVIVLVSGKAKMEHEHVKEAHYSESGEHNEAFDHQSILGKTTSTTLTNTSRLKWRRVKLKAHLH